MSQPVRPEVSDPKLRAVLDRVGPNIENYHVNLDAISNNIRAIEGYLSARMRAKDAHRNAKREGGPSPS